MSCPIAALSSSIKPISRFGAKLPQLLQIRYVADDQKIVRRLHTFGRVQSDNVLTWCQQIRRIEKVQAWQMKIDCRELKLSFQVFVKPRIGVRTTKVYNITRLPLQINRKFVRIDGNVQPDYVLRT